MRRHKLLDGLDLAGGTGLEIGPLGSPVLHRSETDVLYVDHADTDTLRRKYLGHRDVRQEDIVDVDFVWSAGDLAPLVGGRHFQHIVASHVIEHVPDLLGWLEQLSGVLGPFGSVRLAVPDRRFSFDILRRETTLADVLAAWIERRSRPGAREIMDFWGYHRTIDAGEAWRGHKPPDGSFHLHEIPAALVRARDAVEHGGYHDVHCSVFTPASFVQLFGQLAELGLTDFACNGLHCTAYGELEFFIHLMKMDDRARIDESWRWANWHVGENDRMAAAVSSAAAPTLLLPTLLARMRVRAGAVLHKLRTNP